jgi:hypothetical protein
MAGKSGAVTDLVVYDKAKWHYGADNWPGDLDADQAFVHTGLFIGWLAERQLLSDEMTEDCPELGSAVAAGLSGTQIYRMMDGVLTSEDLSDEGNAFAAAYFDFEGGMYLSDYHRLLVGDLPTQYHVADTRENYELLRSRIDERFAQWRAGTLPRS